MNIPNDPRLIDSHYSLIIDAIFGFSFSGLCFIKMLIFDLKLKFVLNLGDVRPPFKDLIEKLCQTKIPICSIGKYYSIITFSNNIFFFSSK